MQPMKKAAMFLVVLAAVVTSGQVGTKVKTVTITFYYPGSTPVEKIVLPSTRGEDDIKKWKYSTSGSCITYESKPGDGEWTQFCGTFKITPNGGS